VDLTPNVRPIPRLPVLGWASFAGARRARTPSVLDQPHVLFTTSGRAAIGLALRALAVAPGDKVLVPSFHCPTMVAPVVSAGAEPLFFPVTGTGGADIDHLERVDLRRVRGILAAHYFGFPQPMARLRRFCDERGIALIEDCAHAFFGTSEGRPVGGWGDFAIASLTKFFPVSEGGCLVSATRSLAGFVLGSRPFLHELKSLANAVEVGTLHRRFFGMNALLRAVFGLEGVLRGRQLSERPAVEDDFETAPAFEFDDSLSGARITCAARWTVGQVHHARIVDLRRRNYALLSTLLAEVPGAAPHLRALPDAAVPYVFPLRVRDAAEPRYRSLRAARVPLFRWDQLWPRTPVIPGDHGRDWANGIFQLGCHQDMTAAEVRAVAAIVRRIFTEVR
jgi:dTDP-4-amino-4,6-dideoxygalactose transaminase